MISEKPMILVAEDDPDDQYFLQEAMTVASGKSIEAHFLFDGAQLLRLLRDRVRRLHGPILIIMDLHMQVKNGWTTLEEIKADPSLANIPVVVLSTSSNEEDIRTCKRLGAADYFQKPSSIIDLVKIVKSLVGDYLPTASIGDAGS